ncbi:TIGR02996 domain-containing protein [Telmatocola sphagniphila]|nr:TIGR02996 domain-containing protein [Telmatocola sphagniphila]
MMPTQTASDRAAFLRRICETPFDDTPRLIYGDWLEEIGEVREAEFIREQIVRPSMIISLATDIDEITGERFFEYDQCRGFFESLECSCSNFMEHAEELFSEHPLTRVKLTDKRPFSDQRGPTWLNRGHPLIQGFQPSENVIETEIFDLLTGFKRHRGPISRFIDSESALEALSRACVDYGRELAGLPKMVWPVEQNKSS